MIAEHVQLIHECCKDTCIPENEFIDEKGELTALGAYLIFSVSMGIVSKFIEIYKEKLK